MSIRGFTGTTPEAKASQPKTTLPVSWSLEEFLQHIAALYDNGSVYFQSAPKTAAKKPAGQALSEIFSSKTHGNQSAMVKSSEAVLNIDYSGSTIHAQNPEQAMTAKDAFAFAKSLHANKGIVENGLKLEIVDDNGQPKKPETYTDADVQNLALCLAAAQQNGLHVINEDALFQTAFKTPEQKGLIGKAHGALKAFAQDASNDAGFITARDNLNQLGTEASLGKKRGTINMTTGAALKSAGYMTKDDFDKVGVVQAELLVIRDAMKDAGGKYDPEKLKLLPTFKDQPDLGGLINKDADRRKLIADLGITQDKFDAALAITNGGKGVPQDKELFVPLASVIQERTCVDPKSKNAALAAQQFERLMSDMVRLAKTGANPETAKKANDVSVFERDTDVSKAIQGVRKELNELEKNAQPGQVIDGSGLLKNIDLKSVADGVQQLFTDAAAAQTDAKKADAVSRLQGYARDSAAFHIAKLGPQAAPAAQPKNNDPSIGLA